MVAPISRLVSTVLKIDPRAAARQARLRYVSDDSPGIRRRRCGKGFSYTGPDGRPLRDAAERARIKALVIPPAWESVWIAPDANSHILATGRDERGRKQYLYHPRWTELRAETNFHQLLAFGEALPGLRARIDADLRRAGLPRERVLALILHLLDRTLIRVGNAAYARDNDSYGLTTLEDRHLEVDGGLAHLEFRGKHGKPHRVDIRDRRVARILRQCQELPGQELFQYVDGEGERRCIDSADVNAYLSDATGQEFTAKVFRTWGGSTMMVEALLAMPPPENRAQAEKQVREGIKAATGRLMNTVAVCRRHYVHPAIARHHLAGTLAEVCAGDAEEPGLEAAERGLMNLLRREG